MMIQRVTVAAILVIGLLFAPFAAGSQPTPRTGKTYRVGYVAPTQGPTAITAAFRQTLAEQGYVEGRNLVIEYRWMKGRESEYPAVFAALRGVDVVVLFGDLSIEAARAITDVTPVVFVNAAEPVALGVVKSLARPGGNMTGITNVEAELIAKRLEILKHLVPRLTRVAVLVHPDNRASSYVIERAEAAGRALGVTVKRFDAGKPEDFEGVITRIAREGFGGVTVFEEPMYYAHRATVVTEVARHRLSAAYPFREFVEAGGLLSYSSSLAEYVARAAVLVTKILNGAKPETLPVERPTNFETVINLKTARALGVTVPPALLLRADHVIE